MPLKARFFLCILLILQISCVTNVLSGAKILYNRHEWFKQLNDYDLKAKIQHIINYNANLNAENSFIEIAVFHGDILLLGYIADPTARRQLLDEIRASIKYRNLYDDLGTNYNIKTNASYDYWLTTKIRSKIMWDSTIDPDEFKIICFNSKIYTLGDMFYTQAEKLQMILENTTGISGIINYNHVYKE